LQGRPHRAPRGNPGEYALFARELARGFFRIGLGNFDHPVDALPIADLRHVRRRPFAYARNLRPLGRLAADDLYSGILFLEVARAAHDSPGRAHAGDEVRDAAVRVAPDLRAGTFVVRQRIVGIGELVEDHALTLVAHLLRDAARHFHAALLRREYDLRPECGHRLPPLRRQVLGHDEDHPIAHHRGAHRERDAGVAAGRLDERVALL